MPRVYVKGHYRDGHWVKPHYRRSPTGRATIPVQRSRNGGRSRRSSGGGGSATPLSSTTSFRNDPPKYKIEHRRSIHKRERDRINEAAEFCVATIKDGAIEATADRIADRVSRDAWNALRRRWGLFRCKWMARLAQQILDAKAQIHKTVADVAMLKWRTPLHAPEHLFAHELIKSIPLPGDEQFIAAAYGLRVAGVCICVMQGISLRKCACFQPLALEYTKEQVKSILVSSGTEWIRGSESGLTD
jgi:hypothetical protein